MASSSASSATSLSDVEQQGVNFALQVIGRENVTLKEKQMQVLRTVIVEKKDTLAVLPTGFGKSLIYQLMAPFADFVESGFRPTESNSIVLVVSPLNALIRDQVTKLRECGLKACILKVDRVALDGEGDDGERVCISESLENLKNFQLIYAHPEALVENKAVMQLLKTNEFQRRVRAIVVDEAHLVVDWYVNFIIYSWWSLILHRGFWTPHISVILITTFCKCGVNVINKKINPITLLHTIGDLLAENNTYLRHSSSKCFSLMPHVCPWRAFDCL